MYDSINISFFEATLTGLGVLASWVALGYTWSRSITTRTKEMCDTKLDKDVFVKHEENNNIHFSNINHNQEETQASLDTISKRVDDILKILIAQKNNK